MYTLHNALVRPEVACSMTGRKLLMAKGGIHALAEEAAVKKLITRTLVNQTGAANTDYSEYDAAVQEELLRLVPSAATLAEAAAVAAAAHADEASEVYDTASVEDDAGEGSGLGGQSSRSGSGSQSGPEEDDEDSEENNSEDGSGSASSAGEEGEDTFSVSSEGTEVARAEKLNVQTLVHLKQTHSIPIDILRALSSAALPKQSAHTGFDPYPAQMRTNQELTLGTQIQHHHRHHYHNDHHAHSYEAHDLQDSAMHVNAMPAHMYQLLMQRLRLTRPERIPNLPRDIGPTSLGSFPVVPLGRRASSVLDTSTTPPPQLPHFFRFDRLHHEQVVVLQDGSVAILQFMYGILEGASLVVMQPTVKKKKKKKNVKLFANTDIFPNIEIYEAVSGSPPAAIRFLHTGKLPTLKPGLTVAVFDALSSVSRAFIIEARSMQRTCEAFGVASGDFTALSRTIAANAHKCVQLTRAGLYCTTVMFSLASLVDDQPKIEDEEMQGGIHDLLALPDENIQPVAETVNDFTPFCFPKPMISPHVPSITDFGSPRYVGSSRNIVGRFSALEALLASC